MGWLSKEVRHQNNKVLSEKVTTMVTKKGAAATEKDTPVPDVIEATSNAPDVIKAMTEKDSKEGAPLNPTGSCTDPAGNNDRRDDFPEDNLDNEEIANMLFPLCAFYPSKNIVEAYMKSKFGRAKCETYQLLKLWDQILRTICNQKQGLQLSTQENELLDIALEGVHSRIKENQVGIKDGNPMEVICICMSNWVT